MLKVLKSKKIYYIYAALIPLLILCIIFIKNSITPFGSNTLLTADLKSQYTIFYSELCDKIKHGESLFLNLNRCLGTDYLSEIAYYCASPFVLIGLFFNAFSIPTAISLMIICKCSLAGLFFFIYLKKHYRDINHNLFLLALSTCYSLSSYFVNYCTNLMWLDGFLIFPIIMLGLERLIYEKKYILYTLSLFYAIVTNFYIGYMICIFCCIYFVYLNFIQYESITQLKKNLFRFFVFSLISCGLVAFILLPLLYNLQFQAPSYYGIFDNIRMYYEPIRAVFRQQIYARPTHMHDPYLYSTILVLLIVPIFTVQKDIPIKQRIGKLFIYFFLLESFRFSVLDYIWNGFHVVNLLAARQSFVFIFISLTIIADVLLIKIPGRKTILYSYLTAILLCTFSMLTSDFTSVMLSTIYSITVMTLYFVLSIYSSKMKVQYFYVFLSIIMFAESFFNTNEFINVFSSYDDYKKEVTSYKELSCLLDDSTFFRVKNDMKSNYNASSYTDYKSIANYSSMQNNDSLMFLYNLGYPVYTNTVDDISYEPVFLSILGVKYIYTKNSYENASGLKLINQDGDKYLYKNEYALSPAILLPSDAKHFKFTHNTNPFEQVNAFAKIISNSDVLYQKVVPQNNLLQIQEGKQLFIYNKFSGANQKFIRNDKEEENIYSNFKNGFYMRRKGMDDNFIYYIHSSPKGGYIYFDSLEKATELVAYTLNANNYDKLMANLSKNQMKVNSHSQSSLEGEINSDKNGIIMTSLAYNKGFTVYVDGKKVDIYSISDTLLAFDISKGYHTIEIKYVSYGFKLGVIVSLLSVLLLIAITIIDKKKAVRS